VWLFEDACSSCSSVKEVLELVDGFKNIGIQFLDQDTIQKRVKKK